MFNMLIKLQHTHWTIHGYEWSRHNRKHHMEKSFRKRQRKKKEKTTLHHVKLVKHVNITELWHSYCGKEWFVARRFSHQYIFDIPHQQTPPMHCSFFCMSTCSMDGRRFSVDFYKKQSAIFKWSIAMDILFYHVSKFYVMLFFCMILSLIWNLFTRIKVNFCSHYFYWVHTFEIHMSSYMLRKLRRNSNFCLKSSKRTYESCESTTKRISKVSLCPVYSLSISSPISRNRRATSRITFFCSISIASTCWGSILFCLKSCNRTLVQTTAEWWQWWGIDG